MEVKPLGIATVYSTVPGGGAGSPLQHSPGQAGHPGDQAVCQAAADRGAGVAGNGTAILLP